MLIDSHCHINIMIKQKFDTPLDSTHIKDAQKIIQKANNAGVSHIINVGTSVIESNNCIFIAQNCINNFAVVGIHPSDCSQNWKQNLKTIEQKIKKKEHNKIVGIGECGLDYHYPSINKQKQKDAFKAQIELALEYNLPLVIHTRDAAHDTLMCMEEFKNESSLHGVFHCFSQDMEFADYAINELGFLLGIGGPITYPNNDSLRTIVKKYELANIILETDAPYLPPQIIRGKKNHPQYIRDIAQYIAELLQKDFTTVAEQTTKNAFKLFGLTYFQ